MVLRRRWQRHAHARAMIVDLSGYFSRRGIPQQKLSGGGAVPMRFTDAVQEHLATRRAAGLFDFSFMGCWEIAGRDALAFIQHLQTRDLRGLGPGKLCYTLLCGHDGSVFNDATVWHHGSGRYWLFTGRRTDEAYISGLAQGFDVQIDSLTHEITIIAVQGPTSRAVLECALAPAGLAGLPYFGFRIARLDAADVWVGRLGYSGESGYEVIVPAHLAVSAWEHFRRTGEPHGLRECGFEAANSLRIESGYVLYSREFTQPVTPFELGLGRFVSLNRSAFVGSGALRANRQSPPTRVLAGVTLCADDVRCAGTYRTASITRITSETRSPLFGCALAFGFVDPARTPGTIVHTLDGRRGRVTRLPFYDPPRVLPRRPPSR